MQNEFKACPFCGHNSAILTVAYKNTETVYYVLCDTMKGGCGASSGTSPSERKAIDLWNTRESTTFQNF